MAGLWDRTAEREEVSYYVMPDFDRWRWSGVGDLYCRTGRPIEQSYKYLDSLDAHHWCELTQQGRYSTLNDSRPLEEVVPRCCPSSGESASM